MSAQEESPNLRRVFFADIAAEQHRIAGGAKADKRAKRLEDFPEVAQVFETPSGTVIEPSERILEERIRIESKLNGDDLKRFNKRRHAPILDLLRRIATGAKLRRAGLANEKSYAAIGRAVIELIGVSLDPPSRDSVSDLRDDLNLALDRFDRSSKRQSSLSKEGAMKLIALDYTLDCLARTLKFPMKVEIRAHLEALGYEYSGTPRNVERQWNRLFEWWRGVFPVLE